MTDETDPLAKALRRQNAILAVLAGLLALHVLIEAFQ